MGDGARLAAARNGTRGAKGSDVTPERWQEVKKVLAAVLEKTPEERTAYLDRADAEPDVRREVKSLLLAEKRAKSSFLAQPAVTPQPELATGNRLGAYEIVARIGAGGMGEVYQARDTKLGRSVAIKVLPLAFVEDQDRLARFQREARVLASLNHPNIATIYGLEQSGSTPYLVMELIPGETLAEQLKSGRLDIAKALGIAQQIAAALESAHEQGIVHRDLKPANIEVTPDGRVKVLDFGLAKPFGGRAGRECRGECREDSRERAGNHSRHAGLHESRTGTWQSSGQAGGYLGVRLRALRDAQRAQAFRRRQHHRNARGGAEQGARLGGSAKDDACFDSKADSPLPGERSEAAVARYWRRAHRD
jgi:serine/threonine protein kinase